MISFPTKAEAADELREQAASCRRLAQRARTPSGATALSTVAEHFDDDAARLEPSPRTLGVVDGDAAALVRLRLALERQSDRWSLRSRLT